MFDLLNGQTVFSIIDLRSAYWHIAMDDDSIEKTAVICHLGLFEFLKMLFGLCNAPAVFQRNMQHVLAGLLGTKCLCYIDDDILVIGKTRQEHDNNLREVLTRLQQHGFKSKPSKCSFGMNSIKLLGHIIDRNDIRWRHLQTSRE